MNPARRSHHGSSTIKRYKNDLGNLILWIEGVNPELWKCENAFFEKIGREDFTSKRVHRVELG
jgi:hypothetical protein